MYRGGKPMGTSTGISTSAPGHMARAFISPCRRGYPSDLGCWPRAPPRARCTASSTSWWDPRSSAARSLSLRSSPSRGRRPSNLRRRHASPRRAPKSTRTGTAASNSRSCVPSSLSTRSMPTPLSARLRAIPRSPPSRSRSTRQPGLPSECAWQPSCSGGRTSSCPSSRRAGSRSTTSPRSRGRRTGPSSSSAASPGSTGTSPCPCRPSSLGWPSACCSRCLLKTTTSSPPCISP
mmetsp:Transcript_62238/g.190112  ORF Transcript_62238/g.190112 Transcript_62238/m.190112 type:complete len:235 (-) Transcript_62238:657-1361(-)